MVKNLTGGSATNRLHRERRMYRSKLWVVLAGLLGVSTQAANAPAGDPKATEVWSPVPVKVTPGATAGAAPSDAIVLFDGKNLAAWKSEKGGGPAKWRVE